MSKGKVALPAVRFEGFSGEWSYKKIGNVFSETSRPVELCDEKEYQLVTVKRRCEGVVPRSKLKGKQILVKNYFTIKSGDFLISKRQVVHGATGVVPSILDNAVVSNEYLVAKDNDEVTADFLGLISKRPEIRKLFFVSSYGVDIEKLVFDVNDWKSRSIYLPSPIEQTKIGSFFQDVDKQLKLHQDKLTKLQQLKKAMLGKMFPKAGETVPELRFAGFSGDWDNKKLADITDSYSGGTPTVGVGEYYGGEIPFIRSGEIGSKNTGLFITAKGLNNSSAKMVEKGCILYALYGATSGEVAISKIDGAINQAILAIKPSSSYKSWFIALWLEWRKQEIISTYLQGGQGNLSGSIVKNLGFDFPCFDEQTKIAEYFQNLDRLINLQQQQIEKLKNLKQAYLAKMFV
ncbi:restriction endonuclease subunit S [Vibrio sp. L3-7]|uniref:restriction endonuclease subunit S n=1 Tax=Vibrio sp. L3-7 TaxID=2912253 RepID=UPI001F0293E9|nr:restriction endonuclease subunit S [Vibrio sp. L3-7]MCF7506052.1 restriction endonuclease subunit S [Vibrio sp. L3-7]